MIYRVTLIAAIGLAFAASFALRSRINESSGPRLSRSWQCRRIVSMAPSITETLYALGLGDRVVGVTRDCRFPPEVKDKVRVGGYYDPNFEAIVALKPDLVVLLEEQVQSLPGLAKLKLETLTVCHKTVDGIIQSFRTIGRVCGKGPEGRRMASEFREKVDRIRERTRGLARPRVLFVLDRTHGCGHLADLYVAADDDYLDTIIEWAGGQNAYRGRGVRYPVVSTEGILRLNPEVIVDLTPPEMVRQFGRQAILDDWKELSAVDAVKHKRVLVFDQDYAYVPGPRFVKLVEELASAIHPEVRN
jgi:iron complex transport system substrate-binding protein